MCTKELCFHNKSVLENNSTCPEFARNTSNCKYKKPAPQPDAALLVNNNDLTTHYKQAGLHINSIFNISYFIERSNH